MFIVFLFTGHYGSPAWTKDHSPRNHAAAQELLERFFYKLELVKTLNFFYEHFFIKKQDFQVACSSIEQERVRVSNHLMSIKQVPSHEISVPEGAKSRNLLEL